jgi:hypothetical protein
MLGKNTQRDQYDCLVERRANTMGAANMHGHWEIECRGPDGLLKWTDEIENIVVNEGLDHVLDVVLHAGTQITTWYVGITDASPTVIGGNTMSSHAGWTENVNYDEAARPTFVEGSVSSQSVSNSSNKAQFTINASAQTIGGAFLTSNATKSGTTGTLYAAGAFTGGNKSAGVGDVISVTATFTSASS